MARVSLAEIQAWLDPAKLTLPSIDTNLLAHLEEEILSRVSVVHDVSGWTDATNTPKLIRTAISKSYASWKIDIFYSDDQEEGNDYAARLNANVEMIISGIIDGTIIVPEDPTPASPRQPSFYPNDASSAQEPTSADPSLGGPYFSLGVPF